ncbi:NADP-dependent oxidoreductase [Levilactobacillus andaensis]|uniref:NADP-dependent oxidoreductase n=1 Tax=Levilactobacillus andaensis TaxID=2799570 RepID=UPI0019411CB3|nr:NADP-dependent oxidoreductase [Levilactobacillus andaensis]
MQAAQLDKYQQDFKLVVREVPTPKITDSEVLVQVKAAAVNPLEMLIGTGSVKLIQDYARPVTMGNELSGVVSAVGQQVTDFKVGDKVYARLPLTKIGAFAEYVAVDQDALAPMPAGMDFDHSAAVPLTGLTAYQGLHEELGARPGQSVMIPGGSGSFGQMAIPIAKAMGMKVSVSGNARAKEQLLAQGVTNYFDYHKENYWEELDPVDYVIDTIGPKEYDHELQVLKRGGRLLSLRMGPNRQFAKDRNLPFWKTTLFTLAGLKLDRQARQVGGQYRFIFVRSDGKQLRTITRLVEEAQIMPAVDPTPFKLADINEALKLVATGHPKGKVLIHF